MEKRDNSGALFLNNKKEKETHPDETGSIMVDGKEYWVSCWNKKAASGVEYRSLAVKSKDAAFSEAKQAVAKSPPQQDDSDIPF